MKETMTATFAAKASAAEVARNFGRFKELAQRGPVAVTSHGRDSVVLISADEYARLKALDDRIALHPADLPDDIKAALEVAKPPDWTKKFNHEIEPK